MIGAIVILAVGAILGRWLGGLIDRRWATPLAVTGTLESLFAQIESTTVKSVEIVQEPAPERVARVLGLPGGTPVVRVRRVRAFKGQLLAFTINYLPQESGSRLRESELYRVPLVQLFEERFGKRITSADQTIEARAADADVAEALGIRFGDPVLYTERVMTGADGGPSSSCGRITGRTSITSGSSSCADARARSAGSSGTRGGSEPAAAGGGAMTPKVYVGTAGMSVWFSPDGGERWERPYSESGLYLECRVWGLTAHPGEPDHVYAGTDIGIYRWSEQARTWTHLPGPLDKLETWALVHDANDPAVMWAGTRPAGLFKTTDAGRTWKQLAVPFVDTCIFVIQPRVTSILLDPKEPGTAWVGVELDGVRRTRDGGRTWQPCNEGMFTADIHGLSLTRHGSRKLFATTNKGLFISENDGDSWTHHPVDSPWQYMRVSHERADQTGTMFISNGDGPPGSTGRILRSRDNGKSWEITDAEGFNSTPWCFATNPADPDRIYCASNLGQLYRSTDGGEHWTKLKREMGEIRSIMWRPVP